MIEQIKLNIRNKKFKKVHTDREMYKNEGIEMNVHANMKVY